MRARGFSLLEVMVAVAILGLALTVILSSQAGLFAAGGHVQRETMAVGLARCKMGEVEERLLRYGYPEMDSNDEGPCCEDQTPEGMRCTWKVQRVELPLPPSFAGPTGSASGQLDLLTSSDGGLGGMPSVGSAMPGLGTGGIPDLSRGTGAIGALFSAGANDAGILSAAGGADGGLHALSSMLGGAASGGVAGLAPLVMSIVYPSLKPMLETSIRKIIVTVQWREGINSRELSITQYVTNPMRGGFIGDPSASALPGGQVAPSTGTATPATGIATATTPSLATPAIKAGGLL